MKRFSLLTLVGFAGVVLAGCGGFGSADIEGAVARPKPRPKVTVATPAPRPPVTPPVPPAPPSTTAPPAPDPARIGERSPHFATPEEAMIYLADAWNNDDIVSLKHVTNPDAREELGWMHEVATNLRLDRCERNEDGAYTCFFTHDYPLGRGLPSGRPGEAIFLVGPADTPGWYMTVFKGCG